MKKLINLFLVSILALSSQLIWADQCPSQITFIKIIGSDGTPSYKAIIPAGWRGIPVLRMPSTQDKETFSFTRAHTDHTADQVSAMHCAYLFTNYDSPTKPEYSLTKTVNLSGASLQKAGWNSSLSCGSTSQPKKAEDCSF